MYNTLTEDRGQGLFQTSTHTAHHWREGTYFPSSNFRTVLQDPIPPSLNCKNEVLPETFYQTTAKQFHDDKFPLQDVYNDPVIQRQAKPMSHYRVNYIADLVEKLNKKPRRPLTMAFQNSEYKDGFNNREPDAAYEFDRPLRSAPNYLLSDELLKGPTSTAFDGRVKPNVPPRKFDPNEQGVFALLDPYLTTKNKDFVKWKPSDWDGIAKKDAVTIYDHHEVPKTHLGYGTKTNPVPRPEVKIEPQPAMIDDIWFKAPTKIRQVHVPQKAVPHTGLTTEARDNFKAPSDVKAKSERYCPIDTPFIQPFPSSKIAYSSPNMYTSDYTNIGSGRLATIPDMKNRNF